MARSRIRPGTSPENTCSGERDRKGRSRVERIVEVETELQDGEAVGEIEVRGPWSPVVITAGCPEKSGRVARTGDAAPSIGAGHKDHGRSKT